MKKHWQRMGKALLAKAPTVLLYLQKFSPCDLQQTYRDKATGAELPVFAVFDLKGNHQVAYEITTDSLPPASQSARVHSTSENPGFRKVASRAFRQNRYNCRLPRMDVWSRTGDELVIGFRDGSAMKIRK